MLPPWKFQAKVHHCSELPHLANCLLLRRTTLRCFWNHKWSSQGWGGAGCHGYSDRRHLRHSEWKPELKMLQYRAHSELGRNVPEPALHLNVWLDSHLACNLSLLKIKWQSEFCGTRYFLHVVMFTVFSIHLHLCFLVVPCSTEPERILILHSWPPTSSHWIQEQ